MKHTQCEQILQHLKAGHTITTMQAFQRFGITRLPDRVRDLRNKGVTVYAEMIRLASGKRVAKYQL
jgi:hypothetical protein